MNQSILLVDDSVTIRRYARSILEGMTEGYEVTEREKRLPWPCTGCLLLLIQSFRV
ncbi:MAG: hypothetical protein Ct9H300mP14_06610 [Gammaproteobacteria bacterium]|nr:MAG: hypothetical protein Ct9H300mP14_06610 [Gammaproteobacteria bacterium]